MCGDQYSATKLTQNVNLINLVYFKSVKATECLFQDGTWDWDLFSRFDRAARSQKQGNNSVCPQEKRGAELENLEKLSLEKLIIKIKKRIIIYLIKYYNQVDLAFN